jgi:hypothetical protein
VADPGMGQGRPREWTVMWGGAEGDIGQNISFFFSSESQRECQKIIKKPKRRSRFLLSECTMWQAHPRNAWKIPGNMAGRPAAY